MLTTNYKWSFKTSRLLPSLFSQLTSLILSHWHQFLIRKVSDNVFASSLSNLMGFLSPHLLGFFLALDSDVYPCPYGNVLSLGSWAILMFCLSLMLLGPILPVWLQFSYLPFSYMRVCLTLCLYPSFLLFFQQLFVAHIHLFQRCTEEWAMDLWVALIYFTGREIVVWPLVHNSFRRWSCISEISIILHYRS